MAPNFKGAFFSSNIEREKVKDPQAMTTIFNRSTWRPNVVVANTATHKRVNFLTPPKAVSKKKQTLKIDSKGHVTDSSKLKNSQHGAQPVIQL